MQMRPGPVVCTWTCLVESVDGHSLPPSLQPISVFVLFLMMCFRFAILLYKGKKKKRQEGNYFFSSFSSVCPVAHLFKCFFFFMSLVKKQTTTAAEVFFPEDPGSLLCVETTAVHVTFLIRTVVANVTLVSVPGLL